MVPDGRDARTTQNTAGGGCPPFAATEYTPAGMIAHEPAHPSPGAVRLAYLPAVLLFFLYAILTLKTAWLCDDAYIMFRTLDNAVHGLGLTWNAGERVQAFTSPLWLLVLMPFYAITHEAYYTVLVVSIVISLAGMLLLIQRAAPGPAQALLGAAVLALSKSYVDYSTSGLENPLTHLLLIAFFMVCLRDTTPRTVFSLALLAALLLLSRLDLGLLLAPPLAFHALQLRSAAGQRRVLGAACLVLLGLTPIIAWELFSIVYFGFPFPNTAYAKLNTGLSTGELAWQGFRYLWRCLDEDPLTVAALAVGLVLPGALRAPRHAFIGLGILLQLVYIVRIGGDFMVGRFLTAPLIAAAFVLLAHRDLSFRIATPALIVIALLGWRAPYSALVTDVDFSRQVLGQYGVTDERGFYYPNTGLSWLTRSVEMPRHPHIDAGRALRQRGPSVVVYVNTGFHGYYAGPQTYIIDPFALSDPLLARLPPRIEPDWRIGHLPRDLPEGYLESIETGQNRIADPALARFYDKLRLITRGPLFTRARWRAIAELNLRPLFSSHAGRSG